jgi:hypothetical protein
VNEHKPALTRHPQFNQTGAPSHSVSICRSVRARTGKHRAELRSALTSLGLSDGCNQRLVPRRVLDTAPGVGGDPKMRSPAHRPERSDKELGEATVSAVATAPGRGHRDNLSVLHTGAEITPSLIRGRGWIRVNARVTEQRVLSSKPILSKLKATYRAACGSPNGPK